MKNKLLLLIVSVAAILIISFFSLTMNRQNDSIKIASVVTTEGQILAYMMKDMIEHYTDEKWSLLII